MSDDHGVFPGQVCEVCGEEGHLICLDAGLERDVGPLIALHDAVLAEVGEWAA